MKKEIKSANPYMPLWEHVPDGEPHVFTYNGETRVYIYGSHDNLRTKPCGLDYVVWSAPIDDLTDWICHGVCYVSPDGNPMYAPDVVQKGDTFYLYAAENRNSRITVSKSKTPFGPFTDTVPAEVGSDVGVLVDDDGSVYAYWGYGKAVCAQLNDDMATIKPGTLHENFIGHCRTGWTPRDEAENLEDGFFEAPSPRKINGKYVVVYSKQYSEPLPAYGMDKPTPMFLSYHYSDSPLDGFKRGGDICYNCGEVIRLDDGTFKPTYQWGNNHGGLAQIKDKWYIFYHRHTGGPECNSTARQAMLEYVEIAQNSKGDMFIGKIDYENGVPIASHPVEMTSQGANLDGLCAYKIISAGYTCHISGENQNAYVKTVFEPERVGDVAVADIADGTTAGFKYLQFGTTSPESLCAEITALCDISLRVRIDSRKGEIIAQADMKEGEKQVCAPILKKVCGKHAVYFEFISQSPGVVAAFYRFYFE